ncbi:MFS transporter [Sulfurospirillum cavolei]|uniref:MFS transporter n=1 Tax=Sulfurospirillum cavolei TaxID=366522 RepID=UPI000764C2F9|nr:MFS transporter [Sulfurospirillum cavolei]
MNINTFRAFQSCNYRLFFAGQSISLMGTWMQRTAVYWVVYMQTHSAFMLGLNVFATQFPSFVFSLIGGIVADRYDRYKVLLFTQILSMTQAIILTLVVAFTHYSVTEILLLSTFLGVINAFDLPARQSLVYLLVAKNEDLGNAIALNSSMVNLARLVGPALSGLVLESLGASLCFMLNALSFMAVIASLSMMKLPSYVPPVTEQKLLGDLQEGLRYVRTSPYLFKLIVLLALISFCVLPYATLLPIVAKEVLNGNALTYGYLISCVGIGALFGAARLASLSSILYHQKILYLATLLLGGSIVALSFCTVDLPAFVFAALSGLGMMLHTTIVNTLLQTLSDVRMRGRVMSYYAMALFGMQPIGALLIGTISHRIGVEPTLLLQGLLALCLALAFRSFLWKNVPEQAADAKTL